MKNGEFPGCVCVYVIHIYIIYSLSGSFCHDEWPPWKDSVEARFGSQGADEFNEGLLAKAGWSLVQAVLSTMGMLGIIVDVKLVGKHV